MIKPNAKLFQTRNNFIYLYAVDMDNGILECYRKNPFFFKPQLPIIIMKDFIPTYFYSSKKAHVKEYYLKLTGDAFIEEGSTKFKKDMIFTNFKSKLGEE